MVVPLVALLERPEFDSPRQSIVLLSLTEVIVNQAAFATQKFFFLQLSFPLTPIFNFNYILQLYFTLSFQFRNDMRQRITSVLEDLSEDAPLLPLLGRVNVVKADLTKRLNAIPR